MESSPRGPVICTVDMACTRDALARADGAVILNVTPGGMESGAEPIFDWHGEVDAKPLQAARVWNAGSRNVGIESETGDDAGVRRWAQRRRAGANIMDGLLRRCEA
jgi:hypothetical protein